MLGFIFYVHITRSGYVNTDRKLRCYTSFLNESAHILVITINHGNEIKHLETCQTP